MEKVRIYELAKELNTTSKRLIEKLAEINIIVKNHMSLLEEHEIKALYKHIGVIQQDSEAKEEEKKMPEAQPSVESNRNLKNIKKNAPRIIRTTEIRVDSEKKEKTVPPSTKASGNRSGKYNNSKRDFVRVADDNSGLRAGFVRDTGYDSIMELISLNKKKNIKQSDESKKPQSYEEIKQELKQEPKQEIKHEVKQGIKQEVRQEIKPVAKQEAKLEIKPESKHEAKSEVKPEVKPETKQEVKPEIKQEIRQDIRKDLIAGNKTASQAHEQIDKRVDAAKQETKLMQEEQKTEKSLEQKTVQIHEQAAEKKEDTHISKVDFTHESASVINNEAKPEVAVVNRTEPREQQGEAAEHHRVNVEKFSKGIKEDKTISNINQNEKDAPKSGSKQPEKTIEISKPDLTASKKELGSQRSELKRDYLEKEFVKGEKKVSKKDILSNQGGRTKKIKPKAFMLHDKRGLSEVLSEDFIYDEFLIDEQELKKSRKVQKPKKESKVNANTSVSEEKTKNIPHKAAVSSIKIPESLTVKDFAEALKKTSTEIIKKLMSMGLMVTVNQEIDFDTAAIVADEFNIKVEKEVVINEEDILFDETEDDESKLKPRPPVVVVMGHVDHGKTSLLDAIRQTHVTESEAGGITQHIGAYTVTINNRIITFLDTPGHEAFTSMRARGAQVTDIAILVVAADDGVMPQTIEAINHAKAANVSIIVAINKIDKPDANPERVKQQLAEYGLLIEEWGGDVIAVPVSAKQKTNIDQLLEMVLLTADIMELKANPDRQAKGTVIEAKLDKNRGPIATLLVQRGTLNVGDTIITGSIMGRVRAMVDDKGKNIKSAGPSTPVEILGLPEVPEAGETFYVITDEKVAKSLIEKRKNKQREEQLKSTAKISLEDLYNQIQEGKVKDLNIIVKADVQGSVEAIKQALEKLTNEEVRINIIHGGVGAVNESDVTLASVSNAIIIGFNVRPGPNVMEIAEDHKVDVRLYTVIYEAIEDIEKAMKGMLEPTFKEVVLGHAEIRQLFKASGVGTIGGAYVTDGKIVRNSGVRIVRNGIVVHEGKLASLKRFKDDVREVAQGFECGLSIERFNDIKEGDIVESYIMEEVKRE